MPTIDEIRKQYPQYGDMSDQALADAMHTKFYSDLPKDQFYSKIGLAPRSLSDAIMGYVKSAGRGVVDAATGIAGLPGAVEGAVKAGMDLLSPMSPDAQALYESTRLPNPQDVQKRVESVTGPLYEPRTTGEKYARSIAEMVPAIAAGPGGLARRAVQQVALPGAAAQAAGDIPGIQGTMLEPVARVAAAVAFPIAAERLITPLRTAPTRAAAVANLRQEGVDVTAGQSSGSRYLRKQEGELGGATAESFIERQQEQFTSAVMRRVGADVQRATPDVVDASFNRIGGEMNRLSANNLYRDRQLGADLTAAQGEYNRLVAPNQRAPAVADIIADINHQFGGAGVMRGDVYQTMRSQLGADARSVRTDPRLQRTLYDIQHALDDAMERAIAANNPGSLGQWREARTQYRNLLVVEKAINYAGEAAAGGLITPQNLARAVKSVEGQRNYSRGRTDLSVLARNGSEVMAPISDSSTASRARTYHTLQLIGAGLGGGAGSALGAHGIVGGIALGAGLPRLAGEGLIRGRRYLGNTAIQERNTLGSSVLRGLLAR